MQHACGERKINLGILFYLIITIVTLQVVPILTGFAQTPLTAKELIETTPLKQHLDEINDGEIVILSRPEMERTNELNVAMAMLVPASLDKTVNTLQRQATAEDGPGILAIGEIKETTSSELDKAFTRVRFTPEEKKEVEQLMAIEPGDEFNLSLDEITQIKQASESLNDKEENSPAVMEAMSGAIREMLKGRYLSYRDSGLAGLSPYQFSSSKQVDPSAELIAATEAMRLLKERFPDYYSCLRFYPEKKPPGLVHQYYWVKQTESNRPLFVLKHWVLDIQPDYALIAERRFYLSHTLNSLQVVIGCLPHGDSTLVVLLNQTFTEKANINFGKTIAKSIGYMQVEKNIRPIFENLQSVLGR